MAKLTYLDYIATLLPAQEVEAFKATYQQKLPKTIKIVTTKISIEAFEEEVARLGWNIEKTVHSDCFYVHKRTGSATLGQHFLHQGGFFYIQELSASMSAPLLEAKPGELILDMCAAPGGKTVQLADTGAFVVANEPANPRRKALIYNLNRTGMVNTAITNLDGTRFGELYPEMFDKVLLDAPCSGEGMSYKTGGPLSRNEGQVLSLVRIQVRLLLSAFATCKPGGSIVYSTCTLNQKENEEVLEKAQEILGKNIVVEWSKKYRPHRDHMGGFFVANLRKINSVNVPVASKSVKATAFVLGAKIQEQVKEKLATDFGIAQIADNYLFVSTESTIYATTQDYLKIHNKISIDKVGIPIYDIARDGRWLPNHHVANIFGNLAKEKIYQANDEQVQALALGKDISIGDDLITDQGFLIVKRGKYGFSLVKNIGGFFKNKMI